MKFSAFSCFVLFGLILLVGIDRARGQQLPRDTHIGGKSTVNRTNESRSRYNSIFDAVRNFAKGILNGNAKTTGQAGEMGKSIARTFGMKRIQFMMMPMIYKMGVMMTMIAALTIISLKGLLIGVILLVLKLSTILAKFYTLGQNQGIHQPAYLPPQPVHLILHNAPSLPHIIENPWQFSSPLISDQSIKGY